MVDRENKPPENGANSVGYGRPPLHSRYQPGRSGNPKGRPKGSKNFRTLVNEELSRQIALIENGQPKKMSKRRALVKKLVNDSLVGNLKAASLLLLHDQQAFEEEASQGRNLNQTTREDELLIKNLRKRLNGNEAEPR